MKFVITLGDAVELAFVALVVGALAIGVVVQWARERKQKKGGRALDVGIEGVLVEHQGERR